MIKHAAVKCKEGTITTGKSHADCFKNIVEDGKKPSSNPKDQGFINHIGDFLSREDAYWEAVNSGQIQNDRAGFVLFSEMLWSPTDGGLYRYCPTHGYFL